MATYEDKVLVADLLALGPEGSTIPTDRDWNRMTAEIALTLEERTRPAGEEVVVRERYLPKYARPGWYNVLPPERWEYDHGAGYTIIAYYPLVGANEV